MNNLNRLEEAVLKEMLAEDKLSVYREQLKKITDIKRRYTGHGFFVDFIFDDSVAAHLGKEKLIIDDAIAEIPTIKHGAGFVLFIEPGLLAMLEGYAYDEPWPDDISGFVLKRTL